MAADGRIRRRSRQMRGGGKIVGACSGDLMKPRGRIRGLVKSGGDGGKPADHGIRRYAGASGSVGHIVKPGTVDSELKPSSADSAEEAWIYIRGCRIERAGLRFDSNGDVYVPDSEDDESSVEVAPVVAVNRGSDVDLAPTMAADGAAGVELAPTAVVDGASSVDLAPTEDADGAGVYVAPMVATDGAACVEINAEVAARLARKVLGEDLHPEVAARLAKVLSRMDPVYHECFIGMYKVRS